MSNNKPHIVAGQPDDDNEPTTPTPPQFNIEALRLSPDFEQSLGVKRLITEVPARKPRPQEWVRVHPDAAYRGNFSVILWKETGDYYLVSPTLAHDLSNELIVVTIYTVINRQRVVFLWPARLPTPDGRANTWHTSAHEAAELAMKRSVRVRANLHLGAYEMDVAENPIPENDPVWPELSLEELLKISFQKTGRWIDSFEHPLIKQLRGA